MVKNFFVTTPIYYVNGDPHLGTVYTSLAADIIARYKRFNDVKVFFLTGTDEHGEKAEQSAIKEGVNVKDYIDKMSGRFSEAFNKMSVSFDRFIRTTDKDHLKAVNAFYKLVKAKGDIYKGSYEGLYCVSCETFWTGKDLINNKCPDCGKDVKALSEESYFFRQSRYQKRIINHILKHPGFIQPESRRNEILEFLKKPLLDLSITRTSFKWGIPFPDDSKHVIYVWFDALVNYLTGAGFPKASYSKVWPADIHFIGKEISRFHCITWLAMLLSAGIKLPSKVFVHGWWTVNGDKMSKSKGNVVYPHELCSKYGVSVDAIRYVLFRQMPLGSDGDFSENILVERFNNELASELGNLLSRSLTLFEKFSASKIPKGVCDKGLLKEYKIILKDYHSCMNSLDYFNALTKVFGFIHLINKFIADSKPWDLVKNDVKGLSNALFTIAQAINAVSALIYPFMPNVSDQIDKQLGAGKDYNALFGNIKPGTVSRKGEVLFKRIDKVIKEETKVVNEGLVSFDEFSKIKLLSAKIINAEFFGNKLIKLRVLADKERIILAGIKGFYSLEELIGRQVIIVANLVPKMIAGQLSEGMVLVAEKEGVVSLLTPDKALSPGAIIH